MGSTRLPGKSLMKILGKSVLWHVINRVKTSEYIEQIIVATSNKERDMPIAEEAKSAGVEYFLGSEEDVLDRFYQAAKKFNASVIVRLTADCPLIDPDILDKTIEAYLEEDNIDYVRNGLNFPEGVGDCEVFSFSALEEAWKKSKKKGEREHVTPYIWKNPDVFNLKELEWKEDLSFLKLSVDYESQFEVVKKIFEALFNSKNVFHLKEILEYIEKHPEIIDRIKDIERRDKNHYLKNEDV